MTPENRSGASGAVGAGYVAQAAPDGATILLDSGGQSVNPFLMRGLSFDYVRDLAPVTLLATLWDADGAVAVAGLEERDAETPDYPEETLRDEAGLPDGVRSIDLGDLL